MIRLFLATLAVFSFVAYWQIGVAYYDGYWVPQGISVNALLPEELAHSALFYFLGFSTTLMMGLAVAPAAVMGRLVEWLRSFTERLSLVGFIAACVVFCASYGIAHFILGHSVITDDEHVFQFIAQTLRTGSVVAPSPGGDLDFFREQFVVLTDKVRFGKYPIGHPILLMVGQILHIENLIVPLCTALLVVPLGVIAKRSCESRTAAIAMLLFAVSPQVWCTGATFLSQPTSALCLLVGLACVFTYEERSKLGWLVAGGFAVGFGLLVRPLPQVFFAMAFVVYLVWRTGLRRLGPLVAQLVAFGLPAALGALAFLLTNKMQSGDFFRTGYDVLHKTSSAMDFMGSDDFATRAMAILGTAIRLDQWLLGWPLASMLALFSRRNPRVFLLWSMVAGEILYRIVSPKVGVGGAGPIYMFEVVPVLVILCADGALQIARRAAEFLPKLSFGKPAIAAILLIGAFVNLGMFLPVKLDVLFRSAAAQNAVHDEIAKKKVKNALIFHRTVVSLSSRRTWAYFPRCNSPSLDDDILFLMVNPDAIDQAKKFWKQRYPERSAWVFVTVGQRPELVELDRMLEKPQMGDH